MKTDSIETRSLRVPQAFGEPLTGSPDSQLFAVGKRAIDIAIALPIVCFVLPFLMVFVSILHAFVSRGPLFFRQKRCGRHGRMFSILKFRTMSPVPDEHSEAGGNSGQRIFRFGNFVRFSKIDEIPQFVNVLRGEMSVVGPRPHHLQDCIDFEARVAGYQQRYVVKPGITGLAQIREYSGEFHWNCTDSRVEADLDYIETRTLIGDIRLILRTFSTVLFKCQQKVFQKILVVTITKRDESSTLPLPRIDATAGVDTAVADESSRKAA